MVLPGKKKDYSSEKAFFTQLLIEVLVQKKKKKDNQFPDI